ncbi:MAG: fatty acid desaturase [Sphingobium sp.]|nr:fatty acid desaturase [Sphingobium sp.]
MTAYNRINASTPDAMEQAAKPPLSSIPDDVTMLRAAAELTRDISKARPEIYWPDMLASAFIGYIGLAGAILADNWALALLCGVVAVLGLYRALGFIHELTHVRNGALPGFRFGWNALVGVPLLIPSFLYEGVHTLHHQRIRYGTVEDPEYLPLALMKPWSLPVFILVALLAPVGVLLRFGILTPLGLIFPPFRRLVAEKYSALSINPAFRRRPAEGALKQQWFWQEGASMVWAIVLMSSVAFVGWKPLLVWAAVLSGVAVLNQLRTLVAHLWENEGEAMTVTAQYLDSVNVPPPSLLAPLWAPVGLRYHALHHLLPSLPYHSLGLAHRRLEERLGLNSTYEQASYPGLFMLVGRLAKATMGGHKQG